MNGSEPTLIPTPFSPREEDALRMIILTVGSLSLVVSMFVILTFLMFKEKRKYTASLNVMFVMSVAFTEFFLVIGAAMGFDSLRDPLTGDPSTYCVIQGVAFLFFGSCLVWFWFFITINLFMRMIMDKDLNNYNLVIAGIILSIIMTLPPPLMDEIGFEGAWCFIDSDATLLIYLDYYAAMGFCSIIGLFLWGAIMWKIYQSGVYFFSRFAPSRETLAAPPSFLGASKMMPLKLLPWVVSVLALMYLLFSLVRQPGETAEPTAAANLGQRHTASHMLPGPVIPVMIVTTRHRPALLQRLIRSIDYKVGKLIVVQGGYDTDTAAAIKAIRTEGFPLQHQQLKGPVGPAEMWNAAVGSSSDAAGWLIVDECVEFEPGALALLATAMEQQGRSVAGRQTHRTLLVPGKITAGVPLWHCFGLLRHAVDTVGLFDPNFYPASHEGFDYLIRLSRAALWLQELPDVRLKNAAGPPSWVPDTDELKVHQQRQEHGRPYFALKWGQSDTVGVFDTEGHWDQRCDAEGHCVKVKPVLFAHPFNDPSVALSYAPYDPHLRECITGIAAGKCRYDRKLVKNPKLLPQGEFEGRKYVEREEVPQREYKKFIYLLQGAKKRQSDPPLHESTNRDIIWLTYHDQSGDLYYPKSSWTQGRNKLLNEAMKRAAEMPDGGYLYYIFLDADVIVRTRTDKRLLYRNDLPLDPYDRFEAFLTDWEPAVGTVAYWWTLYDPTKLSIHHNNDAVFSAHHRETLSFGLPYVSNLDCHSWYYSQHIMNSINAMLYNTRRVQFNGMEARNEEHVALYKREMMWLRPRCFAYTSVLPTSYLRKALVADPNPAYTPGEPTKRGGVSYIVPLSYIRQHFNRSHPIVRRAIRFRRRLLVQHILNASAKASPGQFVEDRRECEPKGSDDHRCFTETCPAAMGQVCQPLAAPS